MGKGTRDEHAARRDKIIDCITRTIENEGRVPSPSDIAKMVGISRTQVSVALKALADEGRLSYYGKHKWYGLAGVRFVRADAAQALTAAASQAVRDTAGAAVNPDAPEQANAPRWPQQS